MLLVLVVSIVVLPRISGCECAAPILPPVRHEIFDFELCFGLLVVAPSMCANRSPIKCSPLQFWHLCPNSKIDTRFTTAHPSG
jgi:hypothetical protein